MLREIEQGVAQCQSWITTTERYQVVGLSEPEINSKVRQGPIEAQRQSMEKVLRDVILSRIYQAGKLHVETNKQKRYEMEMRERIEKK